MRTAMVVLAAMTVGASNVAAQAGWSRNSGGCPEGWGGGDRERACETRTRTLAAGGSLTVDGGRNGGIGVEGWDRDEVSVTARVQANARSASRAEELAAAVRLQADDGHLSARGPDTGRGESWSVSWEIRVPRHQDLRLEAHNGGISVVGIDGRAELRTVNGGLRLEDLAGEVDGRTTNGGVHVVLSGATWDGRGMDVETTNGGIELVVPDDYSAELETGTVNGGIDLDFPVSVRGRLSRILTATLGDGGPPVRVRTTNGGVRVRRR